MGRVRGPRREPLRVARLNAAGTAWEEIVGGENPFNQPGGIGAYNPTLTDVGGVPYVAWLNGFSVNVARLSADGGAWRDVLYGPPVRRHPGNVVGLGSVGGVPYVTWAEETGTPGLHVTRVSRLEPDFLEQAELPTRRGAFVFSKVRTYGVAYPIAFEYGQGTALDHRTATTTTAYDRQEDIVLGRIRGLTPATDYSWRTIGFDGFGPTGFAPTRTFTTLDIPPAIPDPPATPDPPAAPTPLLIAALSPRLNGIVGRRVVVRYVLSRDADVTLEVRRCGGKVVAKVGGGSAAPGLNRVTWNGRIRGRRPAPGCYTLTLRATSSDGQTVSDGVRLRLARRAVRRR